MSIYLILCEGIIATTQNILTEMKNASHHGRTRAQPHMKKVRVDGVLLFCSFTFGLSTSLVLLDKATTLMQKVLDNTKGLLHQPLP